MTSIRTTHAAETWPPDEPTAPAFGALPPIDAGPILMRRAHNRRGIPEFGGAEGEPFAIADLVRDMQQTKGITANDDIAWPPSWPEAKPATKPDPRQRADEPDSVTLNPWRALRSRCAEIAKLQDIQHKQAEALQQAHDENVSLEDAAKLLRAQLKRQAEKTAAAEQAAKRADDEKAVLRAEIDQANANFIELLNQSAELNAAFAKREQEINAVRATVATLNAELAAKAGETNLTAAIEEAKTRYYTDFNKRCAQFETQIEKLANVIGARDEQIRNLKADNIALTARCDVLAARAADLDAGKRAAEEKLEAQTAMVTFLDATLQAERESTGQKIAELAARLQQERLGRAAEAREAALVCKEILTMMPRLAREPNASF